MKALESESGTTNATTWKGYDIDELRYRRAYLLARSEIQQMRLTSRIDSVKQAMPDFGPHGIASRMLKGLSYMDYAFLAYKTATKLFSIISRIKRRK